MLTFQFDGYKPIIIVSFKLKVFESKSAAALAALRTVLGPHGSVQVSSTAADYDLLTCTDLCGPNTVRRAASPAANDDLLKLKLDQPMWP